MSISCRLRLVKLWKWLCCTYTEIWKNCCSCLPANWCEGEDSEKLDCCCQEGWDLDQLAANMKESWRMLGRNTNLLTSLCDSAQRRVRALHEAQGGATKYWVLPPKQSVFFKTTQPLKKRIFSFQGTEFPEVEICRFVKFVSLYIFLHNFNKTCSISNSNTSFGICIEFAFSWCGQLFDYVYFWHRYDTKQIYFWRKLTEIF